MSDETKITKNNKFNWNALDNIVVTLFGLFFAYCNPELWYGGVAFVLVGMFGKVALKYISKFKG